MEIFNVKPNKEKLLNDIEDNILIYKELLDNEIRVLEKLENEDIENLFKRVYTKLSAEEGGLKEESIAVLNKFKNLFELKELELGIENLPDIKEFKKLEPWKEIARESEDKNISTFKNAEFALTFSKSSYWWLWIPIIGWIPFAIPIVLPLGPIMIGFSVSNKVRFIWEAAAHNRESLPSVSLL